MKKYSWFALLLIAFSLAACGSTNLTKGKDISEEVHTASFTTSQVQVISGSNNCQIQGSGNVVVSGCDNSTNTLRGSGSVISQDHSIENFSVINASGPFKVHLTTGNFIVKVVGEDNIVPHVQITVAGNTLNIALAPGSYSLTKPLEVYVTAPVFNAIRTQGQVDILDDGYYQGNAIDLDARGQSKIILDEWKFVSSQEVSASGQSEIAAFIDKRLSSVSASDQSNIKIWGADQILILNASGQSKIQLQGTPLITNQSVSGQADFNYF